MSGGWRVEDREGTAGTLHAEWPSVDQAPGVRAVAVCRVTAPAVVLGSTQPEAVIDLPGARARGIAVARRRSGGGAVLVTPAEPLWVDVWVPAADPLWGEDVGRAFDWLGAAWVEALARVGVEGLSVPGGGTGGPTPWSSLVCFGGVGAGEVVARDGRKVVGLAQRRNRDGAWFHGACILHWEPGPLLGLLALTASERAAAASSLGATAAGVGDLLAEAGVRPVWATEIVASLVASLP